MALSRLVMEICVTPALCETINIIFSCVSEFGDLPAQIYFMMTHDMYHSSGVLYIDDTATSFRNLKLSNFLVVHLIWLQLLLCIPK